MRTSVTAVVVGVVLLIMSLLGHLTARHNRDRFAQPPVPRGCVVAGSCVLGVDHICTILYQLVDVHGVPQEAIVAGLVAQRDKIVGADLDRCPQYRPLWSAAQNVST